MKRHLQIVVFISVLLVLYACERNPPTRIGPTPFTIEIPPGFPTSLNIPSYNPMTYEGVRLGRYLFYEPRLSGRFDPNRPHATGMSCFTCHNPQHSFESGMNTYNFNPTTRKVFGLTGVEAPTAMLPLINLVFRHEGYTWSGMVHSSNTSLGLEIPEHGVSIPAQEPFHFRNLESFAWLMIALPHEIHGTIEASVNAIAAIPKYPPLFEAAFGTPEVTIERIGKAIAQFVRTLISADSRFDRFLRDSRQFPLTPDEMAGWMLFGTERADCFHCHGGAGNLLMTTGGFVNNALDYEHDWNNLLNRYSFTGNLQDRGRFKIPTLRNIALTAPYMHDGRFATLEEVVEFYSTGLKWSPTVDPNMKFVHQGGVRLNPIEKRQLILFLETLTDTSFITNPNFSNPFIP